METRPDLLMLEAVVGPCGDCGDERIFVPLEVDRGHHDGEFCCTACGAAVLIDPFLNDRPRLARGAA